MTRIACLVGAVAVALATPNGATAAGRHEHSHSSSAASHHHHSSAPAATPAVFHPPVVYPAFVGYVPPYSSYSSRQPLTFPRAATPGLIYLPASSPNAPPFSFSESEELPGWNWRRVSLQQIDAEVRAKRAAAAPAAPPSYRKYCPDSRAYYPDVTRCESEWLTVVSKASLASPVVASR
jgi:hypothetical protein